MMDYDELARRVFAHLGLDAKGQLVSPQGDADEKMFSRIRAELHSIAVSDAVLVLKEYEKMNAESRC